VLVVKVLAVRGGWDLELLVPEWRGVGVPCPAVAGGGGAGVGIGVALDEVQGGEVDPGFFVLVLVLVGAEAVAGDGDGGGGGGVVVVWGGEPGGELDHGRGLVVSWVA
jgi:hypothetical protein